jgi:hypothetical protein
MTILSDEQSSIAVEQAVEEMAKVLDTLPIKLQYVAINELIINVLNNREANLKTVEETLKKEKEELLTFVKTIAVMGNRT